MTDKPLPSTNFPSPIKPTVSPYWTNQSLNHLSLPVSDLEKSIHFYDTVLATLGFTRLLTLPMTAGYGTFMSYGFWINKCPEGNQLKTLLPGQNRFPGVHIALQAPSRQAVDEFYKTAMSLGATSDGKPGYRPQYTPDYYACFIVDPDGWKIEAVYLDAWYFIFFRAMWPAFYLLMGVAISWGCRRFF